MDNLFFATVQLRNRLLRFLCRREIGALWELMHSHIFAWFSVERTFRIPDVASFLLDMGRCVLFCVRVSFFTNYSLVNGLPTIFMPWLSNTFLISSCDGGNFHSFVTLKKASIFPEGR